MYYQGPQKAGREGFMGRDLKFSQIAIPLFGNDAGIPKGVGKQTGKTLGIQKYSGLNLQTSWRPTTQCKELHKCHSKNGIKSLGTETGVLINQVKTLFISTSFETTGSLWEIFLMPK